MLRINYGDSYLELNVPPHLASANSFQVQYIAAPTCPIPPDVSLQAQYIGNNNWHNMAVQNGIFTHSGFRLNALKLLLRQYRYQVVDCQMTIIGSVP